MIGTKFYKDKFEDNEYSKAAEWCNLNGAYIEDKGDYYEVLSIPLPTLEELKANKITELKSTRDTLEVEPITTDKGVFDFGTKARDRLDIALKALTASGGTIAWTLADNTQVDVTSSDINNVFLAAATRSNELHEKYRALKEQINACMDAESVSKVTWY